MAYTVSQLPNTGGPLPACGTVTTTGAAMNIELGFVPSCVMMFLDAATDEFYIWNNGMGTNCGTVAAAASLSTGGDIQPYTGSETEAPGFTIAAAVSSGTGYWIAFP